MARGEPCNSPKCTFFGKAAGNQVASNSSAVKNLLESFQVPARPCSDETCPGHQQPTRSHTVLLRNTSLTIPSSLARKRKSTWDFW